MVFNAVWWSPSGSLWPSAAAVGLMNRTTRAPAGGLVCTCTGPPGTKRVNLHFANEPLGAVQGGPPPNFMLL